MSLYVIRTADGRELRLRSLYLEETYAGLLEGTPCKEINDSILTGVKIKASGIAQKSQAPSLVVTPPNTPFKTGDTFEERLPLTTCIGEFESDELVDGHFSYGVIAWFQEEPSMPDQDALAFVNWASFAKDGSI